MKTSVGASFTVDEITFDGDTATVKWWWDVGHDDDPPNTATFRWRYAGQVSMTSGGCGSAYDIDLTGHTGYEPTAELRSYFEDVALAAIPRHLKQQEQDR